MFFSLPQLPLNTIPSNTMMMHGDAFHVRVHFYALLLNNLNDLKFAVYNVLMYFYT